MQDAPPFSSQPNTPGQQAAALLTRAAPTPATILLQGESGVGKSRLARWVHSRSKVATKPFVTVHCPSLSEQLLESELFGHAKGSFTGAVRDHWGKVRAAEGGTLFLDEVGELPIRLQPRLLRLLQEREYERVGETESRRARIRIIAATNRDLRQLVRAGQFREDLFYRLTVVAIDVPPLRERREEIPAILRHMLEEISGQLGRRLIEVEPEALDYLLHRPWRGNLRELRNAIERAAVLSHTESLGLGHLLEYNRSSRQPDLAEHSAPKLHSAGDPITIERLENEHIRLTLSRSKSLAEAAKSLGIDTSTLFRKRRRLGL